MAKKPSKGKPEAVARGEAKAQANRAAGKKGRALSPIMQTLKDGRQNAFLEAFRIRGIIADGLRAAGITRVSYHEWLKDPEFEAARDQALEDANDNLVGAAHDRAMGYEIPVFHQGQPQYMRDPDNPLEILRDEVTGDPILVTQPVYSEKMLLALLQARVKGFRPGEVSGLQTGGVLIIPSAPDPEAWEKATAELVKTYDDSVGRNARANQDPETKKEKK